MRCHASIMPEIDWRCTVSMRRTKESPVGSLIQDALEDTLKPA